METDAGRPSNRGTEHQIWRFHPLDLGQGPDNVRDPLSVVITRTKRHGPPIDARIALGSDCDSPVKFNVTRNGCDSDREEFLRPVKRHINSPYILKIIIEIPSS